MGVEDNNIRLLRTGAKFVFVYTKTQLANHYRRHEKPPPTTKSMHLVNLYILLLTASFGSGGEFIYFCLKDTSKNKKS